MNRTHWKSWSPIVAALFVFCFLTMPVFASVASMRETRIASAESSDILECINQRVTTLNVAGEVLLSFIPVCKYVNSSLSPQNYAGSNDFMKGVPISDPNRNAQGKKNLTIEGNSFNSSTASDGKPPPRATASKPLSSFAGKENLHNYTTEKQQHTTASPQPNRSARTTTMTPSGATIGSVSRSDASVFSSDPPNSSEASLELRPCPDMCTNVTLDFCICISGLIIGRRKNAFNEFLVSDKSRNTTAWNKPSTNSSNYTVLGVDYETECSLTDKTSFIFALNTFGPLVVAVLALFYF